MAGLSQNKRAQQARKSRQQRELMRRLYGDLSEDVWIAVSNTIVELFGDSHHILEEYVRTNGAGDWVWLEESLSAAVSMFTPDEEITDEASPTYEAAFILAIQAIRARYPQVMPPRWVDKIWATLRGTKALERDVAAIARDAFLSGHDQEALDILAPVQDGPFLAFAEGFFREPGKRGRVVVPELPANTSFGYYDTTMDGTAGTEIEDGLGVDEAIGGAVLGFAGMPQRTFVVQCDVIDYEDDEPRSPWDGRIVFVISNDAEAAAKFIAPPKPRTRR